MAHGSSSEAGATNLGDGDIAQNEIALRNLFNDYQRAVESNTVMFNAYCENQLEFFNFVLDYAKQHNIKLTDLLKDREDLRQDLFNLLFTLSDAIVVLDSYQKVHVLAPLDTWRAKVPEEYILSATQSPHASAEQEAIATNLGDGDIILNEKVLRDVFDFYQGTIEGDEQSFELYLRNQESLFKFVIDFTKQYNLKLPELLNEHAQAKQDLYALLFIESGALVNLENDFQYSDIGSLLKIWLKKIPKKYIFTPTRTSEQILDAASQGNPGVVEFLQRGQAVPPGTWGTQGDAKVFFKDRFTFAENIAAPGVYILPPAGIDPPPFERQGNNKSPLESKIGAAIEALRANGIEGAVRLEILVEASDHWQVVEVDIKDLKLERVILWDSLPYREGVYGSKLSQAVTGLIENLHIDLKLKDKTNFSVEFASVQWDKSSCLFQAIQRVCKQVDIFPDVQQEVWDPESLRQVVAKVIAVNRGLSFHESEAARPAAEYSTWCRVLSGLEAPEKGSLQETVLREQDARGKINGMVAQTIGRMQQDPIMRMRPEAEQSQIALRFTVRSFLNNMFGTAESSAGSAASDAKRRRQQHTRQPPQPYPPHQCPVVPPAGSTGGSGRRRR